MKKFINLLISDYLFALYVFSFFLLFIFFFIFIIKYIYVSKNLKGICEIVFNNGKFYKLSLEPFKFYFLSLLLLVFWRETLNIKKNIKFKKLYGKQFYFKVEEYQLIMLFKQFPYFFKIQYLIFCWDTLDGHLKYSIHIF